MTVSLNVLNALLCMIYIVGYEIKSVLEPFVCCGNLLARGQSLFDETVKAKPPCRRY